MALARWRFGSGAPDLVPHGDSAMSAPIRSIRGATAAAAEVQGVEGGRSHPLASRGVQHRVGWLTTTNGRSASPAGAPAKNVPPGIARNSLDRCRRDQSRRPSRPPARRPAPHHASVKAALSAALRFPPTRTPRGIRPDEVVTQKLRPRAVVQAHVGIVAVQHDP